MKEFLHQVTLLFTGLCISAVFMFVLATCSDDQTGATTAIDDGSFVITELKASDILNNQATVTWKTSKPGNSQVAWSTIENFDEDDSSYTPALPDTEMVTNHTVTLVNLSSMTDYYYKAISMDLNGIKTESEIKTFKTEFGQSGPSITDVLTLDLEDTSVTIAWKTDVQATSQVRYSVNEDFSDSTIVPAEDLSADSTDHSIELTDLIPGTEYYYEIRSKNAQGSISSKFGSFGTGDSTGPDIFYVVTGNIGESTLTVTWETDEPATSQIEYSEYYQMDKEVFRFPETDSTADTIEHSVTVTGLKANKSYHYRPVSTDIYGNETVFLTKATIVTFDNTGPVADANVIIPDIIDSDPYVFDFSTVTDNSDFVAKVLIVHQLNSDAYYPPEDWSSFSPSYSWDHEYIPNAVFNVYILFQDEKGNQTEYHKTKVKYLP